MTRLVFVFAILSALVASLRAEPSPTPAASRVKRISHRFDRRVLEQPTHSASTPRPEPKYQAIDGHEVGNTKRTSPMTGPDNVPKPDSRPVIINPGSVNSERRVIINPEGANPERVFVPNEYYEPSSPAAGPGFRSTGSPPPRRVKSRSDIVTSSATRKVAPTKILIPPLTKDNSSREEAAAEMNIDANPPTPSELGAPVVIPMIPRYDAVPYSKALYLPDGNVPVRANYTPPAADAPIQISPTALRAWNGEMTRETRTFDQTRAEVTTGADGARRWQFFWRATGAKPRAARWEISTVPFVDDANNFPPAGLIAYGDASVNAQSPPTENFFAVDFGSLNKRFSKTNPPEQFYLRVVPIDAGGKPAAQPSNWVRVDLR